MRCFGVECVVPKSGFGFDSSASSLSSVELSRDIIVFNRRLSRSFTNVTSPSKGRESSIANGGMKGTTLCKKGDPRGEARSFAVVLLCRALRYRNTRMHFGHACLAYRIYMYIHLAAAARKAHTDLHKHIGHETRGVPVWSWIRNEPLSNCTLFVICQISRLRARVRDWSLFDLCLSNFDCDLVLFRVTVSFQS